MKRLSKAQVATKAELIERLGKAADDVREAITMANGAIETHLNPAIEAYDEVLADLESFRDEIVGEMETYYDERSDAWREGDAGSNYDSWKSDWDGLDVEHVAVAELIEEPDMNHADEFDGLATEVEG